MKIDLNLIPPEKKKIIKRYLLMLHVVRQEVLFSVIFLIVILILAGLSQLMSVKLENEKAGLENVRSRAEIKEIEEHEMFFKESNDLVLRIAKVKNQGYYHGNFLEKIASFVSDSVRFRNINITQNSVEILGWAQTREDLLALQETLEAQDFIESVSIPLSDLVEKQDVEFQITFKVKDDFINNP